VLCGLGAFSGTFGITDSAVGNLDRAAFSIMAPFNWVWCLYVEEECAEAASLPNDTPPELTVASMDMLAT
jgi:hypothetical protein